jgi:hypothetical protein
MTRRWSAPAARLLAAAMFLSSHSRAGVWGLDPVLGFSGDYASNPALLDIAHTSEVHGAVLLDAPTSYNGDAFKLSFFPSFRLGNSGGYSSLDSDYEHFNVKGEFDTERSVLSVSGGVARDSSIALFAEPVGANGASGVAYNGLLDGKAGVERNSAAADVNWGRSLTERSDFNVDINSMKVRYAEPASLATLVDAPTLIDYSYTSITPTLGWASSERGKLTAAASIGRYKSLSGAQTESTNANLQLGYIHQLNELWSLTATAGYSRAIDKIDEIEKVLKFAPSGSEIVVVSRTLESAQNGSVYSVNVSRQATLLLVTLAASRQLVPSGFAYLSRQSSYVVAASYTASERWTVGANLSWVQSQNPAVRDLAGATDIKTGYVSLSASWQWTEHWNVGLSASHVIDKPSPNLELSSSSIGIKLSRKFNRISF